MYFTKCLWFCDLGECLESYKHQTSLERSAFSQTTPMTIFRRKRKKYWKKLAHMLSLMWDLSYIISAAMRQNKRLSSLHLTTWHTIPSSSLELTPYWLQFSGENLLATHNPLHIVPLCYLTSSKVRKFHSQLEITQDTSLPACEDYSRVEDSLCLQNPWVSVSWDPARTLALKQDTEHVTLPEWEWVFCVSTLLLGAKEHFCSLGCWSSWFDSARVILQKHCAAGCVLLGSFEHTELKHKKGTLVVYSVLS